MRVLNISLDKNVADKNSAVARRMISYGEIVEKFTIFVLADKDEIVELSDRVRVISLKKESSRIRNYKKLKKELIEIIKKESYDVLTAQDAYFIGWLAMKIAKKFKLGLEIQVHGFEKYFGIRKFIAKRVLKNADAVRVVSQRLKKIMIEEFDIYENKITVVAVYSPKSIKSRDSRLRGSDNSEKFIFLTVGRLVPVKNIKMQIEALTNVIKNYKDVELWIVGDGEEKGKLQATSNKLKIGGIVKFLGQQNDLEKFYSQADAFLLTSNMEGWGMVVVEAAQYGLPIIMTDAGLAGEVIKDGESGIVIPVGDQEALEQAMKRVKEDEGLRKKLGEGAQDAIKKLPSKEETLGLIKHSWQSSISKK